MTVHIRTVLSGFESSNSTLLKEDLEHFLHDSNGFGETLFPHLSNEIFYAIDMKRKHSTAVIAAPDEKFLVYVACDVNEIKSAFIEHLRSVPPGDQLQLIYVDKRDEINYHASHIFSGAVHQKSLHFGLFDMAVDWLAIALSDMTLGWRGRPSPGLSTFTASAHRMFCTPAYNLVYKRGVDKWTPGDYYWAASGEDRGMTCAGDYPKRWSSLALITL